MYEMSASAIAIRLVGFHLELVYVHFGRRWDDTQ